MITQFHDKWKDKFNDSGMAVWDFLCENDGKSMGHRRLISINIAILWALGGIVKIRRAYGQKAKVVL